MFWKVKAQTIIFKCSFFFFLVIAVYRVSHDTKDAKIQKILDHFLSVPTNIFM